VVADRLARSLNRLARSIDTLLAHEREAAADLSHRLRTPLTALRVDAETLPDPADRARMTRGLDALERAAFWSALADEEQRPFAVSVPPEAVIVGLDGESLSACVDALLVNVFNHTPEGCALRVDLVREIASGGARLTVADQGPGGVDPDRLHRGASGTRSTGLGLDIVRRTANASGGEMTVHSGPHGTLVTVDLGPSPASQLRRDLRIRRRPVGS
jgi:signal transduction histidine kinase